MEIKQKEWILILKNFNKFKKSFNKVFPDINIENIDLNTFKQIKLYFIEEMKRILSNYRHFSDDDFNYHLKNRHPLWKKLMEFKLNGYLIYIHEKKEIELLKKLKINPENNRRDLNHLCHYPAMIEEAKFLNKIAKKLNYDFTNETIAYYNKFIEPQSVLKESNQIIIEQMIELSKLKKNSIDKSKKLKIDTFIQKLKNYIKELF